MVNVAAVDGRIGLSHTDGDVFDRIPPSWSSVESIVYGFIICPPLATVLATIAMCSGTIWSLPWPNPPMASSGRLSVKSSTSPKKLAAGAGRSIGSFWPTPHLFTPSTIRCGPSASAVWAKGMLQLRANTSAIVPPHSSFSKLVIGSVVCGGRNSWSWGTCCPC